MTLSVRKGRFGWLGLSSPAAEAATWRRVPKISLISKQRETFLTPLAIGLLVLIVVEVVVLRLLFGGLSGVNESADSARSRLKVVDDEKRKEQVLMGDAEERIRTVEGEIGSLSDRLNELQGGQTDLNSANIDWGVPLRALLGADTAGFRFERIGAEPTGVIKVSGTATGFDAVGAFQAHMAAVEQTLEVLSFKAEQGDSSLVFNAEIRVRP